MTTNTPTDPLVEALKPFAAAADGVEGSHSSVLSDDICCIGYLPLRYYRAARSALETRSRPVPAEAVEPDCPIKINDERRWLARKLMDSKLSDKEAFGIVAYHPDIKDHWSNAAPATPPAPDLEGVMAALEFYADPMSHKWTQMSEPRSAMSEDFGKRASQALATLQSKQEQR